MPEHPYFEDDTRKDELNKKLYKAFRSNENAGLSTIQGGYGDAAYYGSRNTFSRSNRPEDSESEKIINEFPQNRHAQYPLLEEMIRDPLNEAALTMHTYHAFSSKTSTGEVLFIEPKDGAEDDKIVADLRKTFSKTFNFNMIKWGFLVGLYGYFPLRIYGDKRQGVSLIRDDFYMNPRFIREYRRAGELAGFTHRYQTMQGSSGMNKLIEPWKFVAISIQQYTMPGIVEPMRMRPFDIERDDYWNEEPIETSAYGSSLLSTAYEPWIAFSDALSSLSLSRRNASKRDRFVSINTGKSHPLRAAKFFNMTAEQIQRKSEASARRRISDGYTNTVDNHLFPYGVNGTGKVDIQTESSPVDVSGVEDLHMHLNRLCSAHGLDKSLLGWGDSMSGGLGEGGFFRTAITAAIRANQQRQAVLPAIEQIFDIHCAYKYNKVFSQSEKPWQIKFNSINTAIQHEEAEAKEREAQYATSVAALMQMIDPELSKFNFKETSSYLFNDLLKIDSDRLKAMLSVDRRAKNNSENQPINDSEGTLSDHQMRKILIDVLSEQGK